MSLPNYGAIALVHNYADRVSLAGNYSSLGRKPAFPRQETGVPSAGNRRSLGRKPAFPRQETGVPSAGNCNMLYNKRLQTLSVAETSASQKLA